MQQHVVLADEPIWDEAVLVNVDYFVDDFVESELEHFGKDFVVVASEANGPVVFYDVFLFLLVQNAND